MRRKLIINFIRTMKNILKVAALFVAIMAFGGAAQAQKFGYVNSSAILADLPKVKQANSNIEALQTQIKKRYEADLQKLQTDYTAAQQRAQEGLMTPKEQEEVAAKLQAQQNKLLEFEQKSQQDILKKQEELLQPIINEVNEAIQAVGKENGYQFIFDAQVLLYADDTADVTALVKAKLGM